MKTPQRAEEWSMHWRDAIGALEVGDLVISPGGQVFFLAKKCVDEEDPFKMDAFYFNNPGNKGFHKKDYWGVVYTLQDKGRIVKRQNKI